MAAEHHNPIVRLLEWPATMRKLLLLATLALLPATASAGMYDGTYHGQLTADGNNAMTCAKQAPIQMTVTNDQLEYHHFSNAVIHAAVAMDGKFKGSAQSARSGGRNTPSEIEIIGQITGAGIAAKATVGNFCSYALSLRKYN